MPSMIKNLKLISLCLDAAPWPIPVKALCPVVLHSLAIEDMQIASECQSEHTAQCSAVQPIVQICQSQTRISVYWMLAGVMMMNDATTTAARVLLFVQCDRSSQH